MRLVRTDGYHDDLRKIVEHIPLDNAAAALEMFNHVERSVEQLVYFPNSGRVGRIRKTRELVITGTPYIVVYLVGSEITLARVIHGARRWRKRVLTRKL